MATEEETLEVIRTALATAVAGPKRVSVDGNEIEQYSLSDLILAAKYASSQAAATRSTSGLKLVRLIPDGTA